MKIGEFKNEALFFAFAILPFAALILRYVHEPEPENPRIVETRLVEHVYVDTLLQNEGEAGLVNVWIEQGGIKMCETVAFLARGELRKITISCPDLAKIPFRVVARAQ